jgi:hypothetical protein
LDTNRTNLPYLALAFEHRLYPQAEVVSQAATARTPHDRMLWELLMRLYQLTARGADREKTRTIRAGSRQRQISAAAAPRHTRRRRL